MNAETPPGAKDAQSPQENYGEMTTAWLDAGSQVAEYEAGRAAERKRMMIAILGVATVIAAVVALLVFSS